jgi:hypothetical protein
VVDVEKDEFQKQLNLVVDTIYDDNKEDISNLFPKDPVKRELAKGVVYGIIDLNEGATDNSLKASPDPICEEDEDDQSIADKNKSIIKTSVISVFLLIMAVIVVLFILTYYDYPIEIGDYIKEGILILIFIFVTEFIFLSVIPKNYISTNPNDIKNDIAKAVIDYVDHR